MSQNLYWRPLHINGHPLPDALKYVLRKRNGSDIAAAHQCLSSADIPYLTGLRDAGIDGAQTLIDALEKVDAIEVFES